MDERWKPGPHVASQCLLVPPVHDRVVMCVKQHVVLDPVRCGLAHIDLPTDPTLIAFEPGIGNACARFGDSWQGYGRGNRLVPVETVRLYLRDIDERLEAVVEGVCRGARSTCDEYRHEDAGDCGLDGSAGISLGPVGVSSLVFRAWVPCRTPSRAF